MISFIHKPREVPIDGGQGSNWCHSNPPKVRVHAFYFGALQFISCLVLGAANGWWHELLHCLAKNKGTCSCYWRWIQNMVSICYTLGIYSLTKKRVQES